MSIPRFTHEISIADGLSTQVSLGNEATWQLKTWRIRCTLHVGATATDRVGNNFMLVCASENHNVHS
jgi:hypothetical protein